MNARLSQHLTLLGLCSMAFYGLMLGTGHLSVDVMPQFVISAIIFLSSGRIMKKAAIRSQDRQEEEEERQKKKRERGSEPDWPWLTGLLNWTATLLVIGVMAIFLMKPAGVSIQEAFSHHNGVQEQFYGSAVP